MQRKAGRAPSGHLSRLKPVEVDPLAEYGLPSKGEKRFVLLSAGKSKKIGKAGTKTSNSRALLTLARRNTGSFRQRSKKATIPRLPNGILPSAPTPAIETSSRSSSPAWLFRRNQTTRPQPPQQP